MCLWKGSTLCNIDWRNAPGTGYVVEIKTVAHRTNVEMVVHGGMVTVCRRGNGGEASSQQHVKRFLGEK